MNVFALSSVNMVAMSKYEHCRLEVLKRENGWIARCIWRQEKGRARVLLLLSASTEYAEEL